jgi:hypothetical protein
MRLWSAKRSSASPSTEGDRCADGPWAGLQYDPTSPRGHVESWFLKANDPASHRAIWLKWTVWAGDRNPRLAVAEAWAVAFRGAHDAPGPSGRAGHVGHVATKTSVPFERARFDRHVLGASVDGCTLSSRFARGLVESGGRRIAYDLSIESRQAPYAFYPARWMYTGPVPSQKTVTPIPDARVSGRVEVDGEPWDLAAWPAMVGHNWGRHTEAYAWAQCNAWGEGDDGGEDVVLEGVSGQVRVGGLLLPLRTGLMLRHQGTSYPLTDLRSVMRNEATLSARRWTFRGSGKRVEVKGELWADTDDFVGLFYTNPDGTVLHCLNSKIAHAEVTLRIEGRPPRVLRSTRAALEIGTLDRQHGVRMHV